MLAAVGAASIIGLADAADAHPVLQSEAMFNLTQEQQASLQQIYSDYETQVMPLQRQLQAKRAELDALYYSNNGDKSKMQILFREAGDIEAKLFTANGELRSKLDAKGLAGYAGYGHGDEHGGGHGGGHRRGGHW